MAAAAKKKRPAKRPKRRTADAPLSAAEWLSTPAPHPSLMHHASEIDARVADIHAAVLHLRCEFMAAPAKAYALLDEAIDGLRWQTASMRLEGLGLVDETGVQ
jgi:hypothetical protein